MLDRMIRGRYLITGLLGESRVSTVYLANDTARGGRQVAVKILKNAALSRRMEDIIRFRNEATAVSGMTHPNIIRILEIGEDTGEQYLVMELVQCDSLKERCEEVRALAVRARVALLVQVVRALHEGHQQGIIHRDVNPSNILLVNTRIPGQEHPAVLLTGFGIAQVRELSSIEEEEQVTGTFGYMSPEQCGILKKSIDARSDLYSVGVVFYELLTGHPPFRGESVRALIHQHIARPPDTGPLQKAGVPDVLEKIVLKLLEKEPEQRYQSAKGLLGDLEEFLEGNTAFEPGRNERCVNLSYRTRLVGRDREFGQLADLCTRAREGKGSICLIGGEPGCGKTRLVAELRNTVYQGGGVFIEGKCFSGENKTPYGVFQDALNSYMNFFGGYPEEKKNRIRLAAREAVGGTGAIILNLNPRTRDILGACRPVLPLEPEQENLRFLMTVTRFFLTLARSENGLVLQLDDMQWIDESSMKILKEYLPVIGSYPLLILGTYRATEVPTGHGLQALLAGPGPEPSPLRQLVLERFDRERTRELVAGLLHDDSPASGEIAEAAYARSKGNPLFTIELIRQMREEQVIGDADGSWKINRDRLLRISFSGTIIESILKRIATLTESEQELLSHAALIGKKFEAATLFRLLPAFRQEEIVQIIDKAIAMQLLEEDHQEKGKLIFVHDRIKEAFFQLLGERQRRDLHLKIARDLESTCRAEGTDNSTVLYDMAHHFIEAGDDAKILEYAWPAALRAWSSYAIKDAIRYLAHVDNLTTDPGSPRWIDLRKTFARLHLYLGNPDKVLELSRELLEYTTTRAGKAEIYENMCGACSIKGDFANCDRYGKTGLRLLGERLPLGRFGIALSFAAGRITHRLGRIFPGLFHRLSTPDEEQRYRSIVHYYYRLTWRNMVTDMRSYARNTQRMLNICERRLGPSKELAESLCRYGKMCLDRAEFRKAEYYYNKALVLMRGIRDEWGIAKAVHSLSQLYLVTGRFAEGLPHVLDSVAMFRKIGDVAELIQCLHFQYLYYYFLSEYDKTHAVNDERYELCVACGEEYGKIGVLIDRTIVCLETGRYEEAARWGRQSLEESEAREFRLLQCGALIQLGRLALEEEDCDRAVACLEQARTLFEQHDLVKQYSVDLFYFLAEALVERFRKTSGRDYLAGQARNRPDRALQAELAAIRAVCVKALHISRDWINHHMGALRANARYHALVGNNRKADQLYGKCIAILEKLGKKYELARVFYQYSLFLRERGRAGEANALLGRAYGIFKEIGSTAYQDRCAALLGIGKLSTNIIERLADKQRFSSIITVSRNISSILNIEELMQNVLTNAIEVTGAQSGILFILDNSSGELVLKTWKGILLQDAPVYSREIVEQVRHSGTTLLASDAGGDARLQDLGSVRQFGLKSILCTPILRGERTIGVCYLDNRLSSGVFTDVEQELMQVFMAQVAICIENAQLVENLEHKVQERTRELDQTLKTLAERNQSMENDLSLARRIQLQYIPSRSPDPDIAFYYRPMEKVGGDYFDFFNLGDDDRIGIFLSDVSGHGVAAAFITSMVRSNLWQLASRIEDPAAVLEHLNERLVRQTADNFITALYGIYNRRTREFTFAVAGHPPPCLLTAYGLSYLESRGKSVPLAMLDHRELKTRGKEYRDETVILPAGSRLVLYTDGLTEAVNMEDNLYYPDGAIRDFAETGMEEAILKLREQPAGDFVRGLTDSLIRFRGKEEFEDDVCIICLDAR